MPFLASTPDNNDPLFVQLITRGSLWLLMSIKWNLQQLLMFVSPRCVTLLAAAQMDQTRNTLINLFLQITAECNLMVNHY